MIAKSKNNQHQKSRENFHSKWFIGNNHITNNSSAITLTSALLFLKN